MASFADFSRDIKTVSFKAGTAGGEITSEEMATFARAELARVIETGEGSPIYDLFVNGRAAVNEFEVDVPGAVVYVFSWWQDVIARALVELIKRSPRKSGRYAASFIVLVDGRLVEPGAEIASDAEVTIVNAQPYTRKIEVGAMTMSVPPRHFEGARRAMSRAFGGDGGYSFSVKFLRLSSGIHPLIPYVLRGSYARKRNAWLGLVASGRARHGVQAIRRRSDQQPGQPISYPALIMRMAS